MKKSKHNTGLQILIAIDQLFNTLLAGWADETLSSRSYRNAVLDANPKKRWRFSYHFINALFFNKNHCKNAYASEQERNQLPFSMRLKK
ncbi:MAG: DNA helicase UvrD [Ostreibacterium sp.]